MSVTIDEHETFQQTVPCQRIAGDETISKPLATIENWAVVEGVVSQRFEVLQPGHRLRGHIFGLANLSHTKLVHTSPIVNAHLDLGFIETRNTIYRLGKASEEYELWSAGLRK